MLCSLSDLARLVEHQCFQLGLQQVVFLFEPFHFFLFFRCGHGPHQGIDQGNHREAIHPECTRLNG